MGKGNGSAIENSQDCERGPNKNLPPACFKFELIHLLRGRAVSKHKHQERKNQAPSSRETSRLCLGRQRPGLDFFRASCLDLHWISVFWSLEISAVLESVPVVRRTQALLLPNRPPCSIESGFQECDGAVLTDNLNVRAVASEIIKMPVAGRCFSRLVCIASSILPKSNPCSGSFAHLSHPA